MITITYFKTANPNKVPLSTWKASSVQKLDDNIYLFTYLCLESDKERFFDGVWFSSIHNPLTKLRDSGKLSTGNE